MNLLKPPLTPNKLPGYATAIDLSADCVNLRIIAALREATWNNFSLLRLIDPQDGDTKILRNVVNCVLVGTAYYYKTPSILNSPPPAYSAPTVKCGTVSEYL